MVNWKSPGSRFTNCCLKKLCYFTPVSLTKTLLIKKLSGKKLEVLLAKNQSRKPGETALMGEIMVTTATGSRNILFLFPSLSSCPDSLRWITNQRDCSHWPQQGLSNAVFHCKLEVRISRCVFLTSYSYRPMHLLRKNMDAANAANRCLNGNYSSWFNSQGNLKNVSQNEQYIK